MRGTLILKIVFLALAGVVLLAGARLWLHSDDEFDARNLKYVLWKAGLSRMDLDRATRTMLSDSDRDKLVIGKTKQELKNRFGPLQTLDEVSPYYRMGYEKDYKGKDVLFIRNSPWMIVFEGDRATNLVLMKGY